MLKIIENENATQKKKFFEKKDEKQETFRRYSR